MESPFSKQAHLYAKYRPTYPDALFEFIFEHLSSADTAWDCATGSGQVAGKLAGRFQRVIATDISKEQLSYAPKLENITYYCRSAEESKLPPNIFDLVTVAQAIHWLDFEDFYKEVRRVSKPNALLAVIGYGMVHVNSRIEPVIKELYHTTFSRYYSENRKFLNDHYRNIPFPFEEIPAPEFVNKLHWTIDDLQGYFNSWSTIQKFKTEQQHNPVDAAIRRIRNILPATGEPYEVSFPVFLRLGTVSVITS